MAGGGQRIGAGRPRKAPTKLVSVRLPLDVIERWRAAADAENQSLSDFIRRAVDTRVSVLVSMGNSANS